MSEPLNVSSFPEREPSEVSSPPGASAIFDTPVTARDVAESSERDVIGQFLAMSIEHLQRFRPDLTDEVLLENHIVPGRDFVMIFNGTIMRHFEA